MAERILILGLVTLALIAAVYVWRLWQQRRLKLVAAQAAPAEVVQMVGGQQPALLYFTTLDCTQCHLQQAPILSQLASRADVAIHKLDAVEQEALARFYGIMTVPTTVVLDRHLQPVAVNHGVTPLQKLRAQVEMVGEEMQTQSHEDKASGLSVS